MNTVSVGSPNAWMQYVNNKDCSQGFCTIYCPQWCYIVFPPPPPFGNDFPDQTSGPNFSPLVITIICILAGAFLLVSYYAIISKYCISRSPSTRQENNIGEDESDHIGDYQEPFVAEPWFVATNGLDDALIRSITVFKYQKGEELSQGMDCSVCLSEFQEHDSLRLLPKCNHAFHVPCIDTWLRSHSNCPLCRANVAPVVRPSPPAQLAFEFSPPGEPLSNGEVENADAVGDVESSTRSRETLVVEIRDEDEGRDPGHVRRSMSMDCIHDHHLARGDAVGIVNREGESNRDSSINTALQGVMKRSHSSGRWFFSKNSVIPL